MATGNTKTISPLDWDVRVRERNLRKGLLDEKEVDRQLSQLPDLADQCDAIAMPQPALGGRED